MLCGAGAALLLAVAELSPVESGYTQVSSIVEAPLFDESFEVLRMIGVIRRVFEEW